MKFLQLIKDFLEIIAVNGALIDIAGAAIIRPAGFGNLIFHGPARLNCAQKRRANSSFFIQVFC